MKIDTHVHVTPPDIIRNFKKIGERETYFGLLSNTPHNKFATAEEIVSHMDTIGFDQSIVFGFSFQDMGLCRYVNDYVIEKVKEYPDRLIGFASVVPNHKDVEKEIQRCYEAGLWGIGELFPAGQNFEISRREDTQALAECCKHYQMPVIVHANEPIGHYYAGKTDTSLKELEAFVEHHPELKIILAHWGGGIFMYEMMKEIKEKFKNVYYDNAATVFLYEPKIYHIAKEMGLINKLLFGSDFPLLSPSRYEKGLQESGLGEQDLKKLYGDNAQELFRLCGKTI